MNLFKITLTLMKGDKVVEGLEIVADSLLLLDFGVWNLDSFHSVYINTFSVTNAINVWLKQYTDEKFRPKKRIIKSSIYIFSVKNMIGRTDNSL